MPSCINSIEIPYLMLFIYPQEHSLVSVIADFQLIIACIIIVHQLYYSEIQLNYSLVFITSFYSHMIDCFFCAKIPNSETLQEIFLDQGNQASFPKCFVYTVLSQ